MMTNLYEFWGIAILARVVVPNLLSSCVFFCKPRGNGDTRGLVVWTVEEPIEFLLPGKNMFF